MKMYIAVREDFPDYMTPTLVAHAVLRHELRWGEHRVDVRYSPYHLLYMKWRYESFKKVVIRVSQEEFDTISWLPSAVMSWENKTCNGELTCATIVVDNDVPNVLKFAKLWKPKDAP